MAREGPTLIRPSPVKAQLLAGKLESPLHWAGPSKTQTDLSTDGQGQALGGPPMLSMMLFYGDVLSTTEGYYDEPSNFSFVTLLRHDN